MPGQIIKRGERSYTVRIFLGRENGKRRYFNKTIRGTRKDAERYLTAKLREKDLGAFVEPAEMTLNAYLDKWLATAAKPRLRDRTHADYTEYLKRYVRRPLGFRRLSDIQPLDIQNLYTSMLERGLSARTVRYLHAIFSNSLKQAVKWRILSHNPADAVDLPRQQRREMSAFSPEDAAKFLAAAKEDKWFVIFSLALSSGCRPEEYLGLQWRDVNFTAGTIIVRRALVWQRKGGGGWALEEPKTPQSRRTIPLPQQVMRELAAHRRRQMEERLAVGPEYQNNDFVFATPKGTPILAGNLLRRHFKSVLKRAGLSDEHGLYVLRHSCATLLLSAGESAKIVSERLGHASIVLTLDCYSHVLPNMQRAASEKLERLLFG